MFKSALVLFFVALNASSIADSVLPSILEDHESAPVVPETNSKGARVLDIKNRVDEGVRNGSLERVSELKNEIERELEDEEAELRRLQMLTPTSDEEAEAIEREMAQVRARLTDLVESKTRLEGYSGNTLVDSLPEEVQREAERVLESDSTAYPATPQSTAAAPLEAPPRDFSATPPSTDYFPRTASISMGNALPPPITEIAPQQTWTSAPISIRSGAPTFSDRVFDDVGRQQTSPTISSVSGRYFSNDSDTAPRSFGSRMMVGQAEDAPNMMSEPGTTRVPQTPGPAASVIEKLKEFLTSFSNNIVQNAGPAMAVASQLPLTADQTPEPTIYNEPNEFAEESATSDDLSMQEVFEDLVALEEEEEEEKSNNVSFGPLEFKKELEEQISNYLKGL